MPKWVNGSTFTADDLGDLDAFFTTLGITYHKKTNTDGKITAITVPMQNQQNNLPPFVFKPTPEARLEKRKAWFDYLQTHLQGDAQRPSAADMPNIAAGIAGDWHKQLDAFIKAFNPVEIVIWQEISDNLTDIADSLKTLRENPAFPERKFRIDAPSVTEGFVVIYVSGIMFRIKLSATE
jgi:hypothetical protein